LTSEGTPLWTEYMGWAGMEGDREGGSRKAPFYPGDRKRRKINLKKNFLNGSSRSGEHPFLKKLCRRGLRGSRTYSRAAMVYKKKGGEKNNAGNGKEEGG